MTDTKLKTGYVSANGVVITPVGRGSFVNVHTPQVNKQDPAKGKSFNATLLFDKDADLTILKQEAQKALVAKFGEAKMKDQAFISKLKTPFRDQGDFDYEGYTKGLKFIRATAKEEYKPGVVDANNNDLLEPRELYSGAYMRFGVVPFAYDTAGNKGVSFGLRMVQKIRDGEPLGGAGQSNPSDNFEPVGEVAVGATAGSVFD